MSIRRLSGLCLVLLACGGGEGIRNPELDRWCGNMPCDWMVEGDVERVGTWHTNDYAVELISDDAQINQINGSITESANCLAFSLVAKIDRGVRVFLELDFMNDGSIDFSQQLPTSDWDRLTFNISAPDWYRGVRFIVRKDGPGRAIVAELGATKAWGQCTAPPVELSDRPAGAHCTAHEQCTSGSCTANSCSSCRDEGDCAEDELCGLVLEPAGESRACTPKHLGEFGSVCLDSRQCESGICANSTCSECIVGTRCEDGQTCLTAMSLRPHSKYWPSLCGPGQHARDEAATCTIGSDCKSGRCSDVSYSCAPSAFCPSTGCSSQTCAETMTSGGVCE